MPKHEKKREDNHYDGEKRKKHKHRRNSDEPEVVKKKHKKYASDAGASSPHPHEHKSHKSKHEEHKRSSPITTKVKDIKKERNAEPSRSYTNERSTNNRRIKREEDFDRRQEELRRSRAETQLDFQDEKPNSQEKEKPNLGLSGALTEDTNTFRGVVIKYNEPPEARTPKKKWRLYPFKGEEALKILHLHRQSAFLLGRQRRIADIPVDHPSCSKQHAVLQFRMVEVKIDGKLRRRVKPYVIDLGSANGTYVNNERIEAQRYVELKEKDVLKFGFSSREYVLLHDKSDTREIDSGSEEEEEETE